MFSRTLSIAFSLTLSLLLLSNTVVAAPDMTGPEIAQSLNRSYQKITRQCPGNKPAYYCSGIMLRGSQGAAEFWKHSASATALGAEGMHYLRADLDTRTLPQNYGAVFSDQFTTIGDGKELNVLCVYPFDFPVQSTRPDFGCGWTAAAKRVQDVSSCAALGVTDSASWLAHFAGEDSLPAAQCSLSSNDPAQFAASLTAHQALDDTWSAQPVLLKVKNWPEQAPAQLPLLALFHDVNQLDSLLGAQRDQRDYFKATDQWLPIVRMDLTQPPDQVFGFTQREQLYTGYEVAARLNARSIDPRTSCEGNSASFNCAGVLVRSTSGSTGHHAWDPSPSSTKGNGVSFTFIHPGARVTHTYKAQGFIVRESFAPSGKPLTVRCLYPFDASTGGSADICRTHGGQCEELGITSRDSWVARYASRPLQSCAFNTDPQNFQLATTVRPDATDPYGWNELIMAAWTGERPEQLPLEAIATFNPSRIAGDRLTGARYIQRDYFNVTGRFLPLIRVEFAKEPGSIFSYDVDDQALGDTDTQALINSVPFEPTSMRDD
ncbi:hypothetical protein [Pseudomonas sp. OB66]|uniref:hypothetical protein n=1 Tax=Pseudomonas sp. OB66 TaxID=3137730 RepID=UPI00311D73F1